MYIYIYITYFEVFSRLKCYAELIDNYRCFGTTYRSHLQVRAVILDCLIAA